MFQFIEETLNSNVSLCLSACQLSTVYIDCFHYEVQYYVNYLEDSDHKFSPLCLYFGV